MTQGGAACLRLQLVTFCDDCRRVNEKRLEQMAGLIGVADEKKDGDTRLNR